MNRGRTYTTTLGPTERCVLETLARYNRAGIEPTTAQVCADLDLRPRATGEYLAGLREAGLVSGRWLTPEGEAVIG